MKMASFSTATTPYSSMLSGKGSLFDESLLVMQQLAQGRAVNEVKAMVMQEDLLGKATASTRASSWDHIHARYLSSGSPTEALARMVANAPDRHSQRLVLFYELCRSSSLVRDTVIGCVYPRYAAGYSGLDASQIQTFLDQLSQDHPEINTWSPQTRSKIVSNILSILRDFGLLEGTQRKRFTRLYVPLPAFVYVLYRLAGDGLTAAADLIAADDWRLFLLEGADVVTLLEEANAAGHCTYKRRGDIQTLDLSYPSLEACVEALTRAV